MKRALARVRSKMVNGYRTQAAPPEALSNGYHRTNSTRTRGSARKKIVELTYSGSENIASSTSTLSFTSLSVTFWTDWPFIFVSMYMGTIMPSTSS